MTIHTFFLGGTGARAYRALVHSIASGMYNDCLSWDMNFRTYLIDPDMYNSDTVKARQTAQNYQSIYSTLKDGYEHPFWSIPLIHSNEIDRTQNDTWTEILNKIHTPPELNENGRLLVSVLLGKNTSSGNRLFLNKYLMAQVGMSSLPLHGFNREYNAKEDIVFIIGSTFGATGAAGFPGLIQRIRQYSSKQSPIIFIQIGPYIKPSEDLAYYDCNTQHNYIDKYFQRVLNGEMKPDCIYRIGLTSFSHYANKNAQSSERQIFYPAHFLELWTVSAIFDYLNKRPKSGAFSFNIPGLESQKTISPNSLPHDLRHRIEHLLCFSIWCRHFGQDQKLTPNNTLREYADDFCNWIQEMKDNSLSLNLIDFNNHELSQSFNWFKPAKPFGLFNIDPLSSNELNKATKKTFKSLYSGTSSDCRRLIAQSQACQAAWKLFKSLC